ncbi:hypothetical protein [Microbacterium sp. ABRD28]|uniref:hypothetical protein n=1 Tax=Microbacterium sp. ABRD28 TaxID=2268461 RepID=UPI000F55630C|nr:hypothetical protein [Microbacterium sp. ABRD28]AZC14564.1 hypothetical protein DT073_13360 [Microbacterium sp. ABRD28]
MKNTRATLTTPGDAVTLDVTEVAVVAVDIDAPDALDLIAVFEAAVRPGRFFPVSATRVVGRDVLTEIATGTGAWRLNVAPYIAFRVRLDSLTSGSADVAISGARFS